MNVCSAARHGDRKAYDIDRCRCPAALADHARYERIRNTERLLGRPRLIDATGTRRRLQALMAIGWPSDTLAVKFGYTDGFAVRKLCSNRFVRRSTAERVARVYAELADTPGPSVRVCRWAQAAGMLPPIWWDDDTVDDPAAKPAVRERAQRGRGEVDLVVVDRLVDGARVRGATRTERFEAFCRLRAQGLGTTAVCERLHIAGAT
ncbi:MAG: hypothetical protein JO222_06265, partial [Frankiales bacterium]|nr:hypothetical protein [Frankiales bacterium]